MKEQPNNVRLYASEFYRFSEKKDVKTWEDATRRVSVFKTTVIDEKTKKMKQAVVLEFRKKIPTTSSMYQGTETIRMHQVVLSPTAINKLKLLLEGM